MCRWTLCRSSGLPFRTSHCDQPVPTRELSWLLQGNAADELPESLLGTMRLTQIDLSTASYLDVNTGKLHPKD